MADEVSIHIGGVTYVRNPYDTGSISSLLIHKGVEYNKANEAEEDCRKAGKGKRIKLYNGITITT